LPLLNGEATDIESAVWFLPAASRWIPIGE